MSTQMESQGQVVARELPNEGRRRVVIEQVQPEVDAGRFPVKRTAGGKVVVEADAFADGHDELACVLQYRQEGATVWSEVVMTPTVNDRWRAEFAVSTPGKYLYTVTAWIDHFASWRHDLSKRIEAADIEIALRIGADLIEQGSLRATDDDAKRLQTWADLLRGRDALEARRIAALDGQLAALMAQYPDRRLATTYLRELPVIVDRERAGFGAWYELFPRSCKGSGQPAALSDCEPRLAQIVAMGFDVLYLPPVHPIGHSNRKGRNNALQPGPGDPGSPWAIGSEEGGHKALDPQLGTFEDFDRFTARAGELGLELALDIAFQCSPDHPYVREHPEWFRWRPDGTVQYAENPPKKYQDIYPLNFESEQWQALWQELHSVFVFWIGHGVRIFRVDNPHTKPFPFWEWVIGEIKKEYPDVLFLAEAFSRPKIMYRLAKAGFSQSYTYFAWRNTKWELAEYLNELTKSEVREFFRPNFWPNTPDILTEYLQFGGRPAFMTRLVLAATLSANYGIYGPAFELFENRAREPGSEEYLNSEKYEVRDWDVDRPDSLRDFIARVNRVRRENSALQQDWNLRFHKVDNDELICFSKWSEDLSNLLLMVVNLDPFHTQSGWVEIPLEAFGLDARQPYQVHDLLSGARFLWHGARNFVELDPRAAPAHIFRVRRRVRTERDFEYFF